MNTFAANLLHLGIDRVRALTSESVHARAQQKVCSSLLGGAEQLVDVALPIADVNASCRLAEQQSRLPKILQP